MSPVASARREYRTFPHLPAGILSRGHVLSRLSLAYQKRILVRFRKFPASFPDPTTNEPALSKRLFPAGVKYEKLFRTGQIPCPFGPNQKLRLCLAKEGAEKTWESGRLPFPGLAPSQFWRRTFYLSLPACPGKGLFYLQITEKRNFPLFTEISRNAGFFGMIRRQLYMKTRGGRPCWRPFI
ncbi:hypothetical protein Cdeb_01602 [Caldibacillus debilis GB1]|uniref:Uncharacterized protein n=1 Tax=Caldibacillus debilis GB1 TaxID=1339248 RepID=A0A420VCE0_9BACI|nr:hypothetical protein Cdeb_01602 [Caldibacillus debilis GB1]